MYCFWFVHFCLFLKLLCLLHTVPTNQREYVTCHSYHYQFSELINHLFQKKEKWFSPFHKCQKLLETHFLYLIMQFGTDFLCFTGHGINALQEGQRIRNGRSLIDKHSCKYTLVPHSSLRHSSYLDSVHIKLNIIFLFQAFCASLIQQDFVQGVSDLFLRTEATQKQTVRLFSSRLTV